MGLESSTQKAVYVVLAACPFWITVALFLALTRRELRVAEKGKGKGGAGGGGLNRRPRLSRGGQMQGARQFRR